MNETDPAVLLSICTCIQIELLDTLIYALRFRSEYLYQIDMLFSSLSCNIVPKVSDVWRAAASRRRTTTSLRVSRIPR